MCTKDIKKIPMGSHALPPSLLLSMDATTVDTSLPALPWFIQGCYVNSLSFQPKVFPSNTIFPQPTTFQHQLCQCSTPAPQNQTSKSFLIKDILGIADSTSQITDQVTGRSSISLPFIECTKYLNYRCRVH